MGLATVAPSAQAPTHYLPTPGTGMLAACVGACVHVCVCAWLHGCVASQTEVRARHACMYDGCRPINQSTHTVSPCTGKAKACARHACACTMAAGQSWPGASMLCQHTSLHIDRKPVCSTYMASQHAVHTDSDVAPLYIEATRRARNKGAAVLCQHNFLHTHSKPACGTYTASRHAVHKAVTWHLCI